MAVILFRIISVLEGVSFLVLLGVAMPAKYVYKNPSLINPIGMAHGVLFLLFIVFAIYFAVKLNWKLKITSLVLLSSVLPFGTFVAEYKLLRNLK